MRGISALYDITRGGFLRRVLKKQTMVLRRFTDGRLLVNGNKVNLAQLEPGPPGEAMFSVCHCEENNNNAHFTNDRFR